MYDTKILRSTDHGAVAVCAELIKAGHIVAFPTETVYGLGANGLVEASVARIFEAKRRPADNPVILHIADIEDIYKLYEDVPEKILNLCKTFWPGALTIVYKKSEIVPNIVTAGNSSVAIRMPNNACAQKLIRASGVPLAAPSANISGRPSPTRAKHVFDDLNGIIAAILDGGDCELGLESTVLSMIGEPTVLRPGGVTLNMLGSVLGKVHVAKSILSSGENDGAPVLSPGMKYTHYAPKSDVYAVTGDNALEIARKAVSAYDEWTSQGFSCIILGSAENEAFYSERNCLILGNRENAAELCASLFNALRLCEDYDRVLCEALPAQDLGMAYMNRLLRASAFRCV